MVRNNSGFAGAYATCTVQASYHQRAEQVQPVKRKFARYRPIWPGRRVNRRSRRRDPGVRVRARQPIHPHPVAGRREMQSASRARLSADDCPADRLIVGVVVGQYLMDEELVSSSRRRKRVDVGDLTTPVSPPRASRVGTPPDDDSLNHDHRAYSAGRLAVCVPVKRGRSGRPDQ
ncbi:hypothetical protein AB0M47_20325 [Hamadaea sp. NPDC051192]|uniref:hypothetical protein n=1 Tax=Hamadaea sp. NPDC051192 TaxID=3154940 RepID=UPI0034320650